MENEAQPRTASQVILDLEAKIDTLTELVKAQTFANQLLSNKILELTQSVKAMSTMPTPQNAANPAMRVPTAEAVDAITQLPISPIHSFKPTDPERQIPIFAEKKIMDVRELVAQRRNAKPDNTAPVQEEVMEFQPYAPKPPTNARQVSQQPQQQPNERESLASYVQKQASQPQAKQTAQQQVQQTDRRSTATPQQSQQPTQQEGKFVVQNAVPITQRVVDGNGKSQFLAEVEIVNADTSKLALKTKTNANGKWVASLSPGNYQVVIRKKGNGGNIKDLQAVQTIPIDGNTSPLEIKTITIKPA